MLVAPDKFKGTLSAREAAEAIATGWSQIRPADHLELLPMSDGGDGFGGILAATLGAEHRTARTVNSAHDPLDAEWWWSESEQTAVVESAKIVGLAMLPPGRFHPFQLDTYGLGQLLRKIGAERPNARVLIGIGGSATNDAGFGLARGLGFAFTDGTGHCLDHWVELDRLFHVAPPADLPPFAELIIASDVQNPLLGAEGASRVYGPQKGLRAEDYPIADRCFQRLVEVVRRDLGRDASDTSGAGAAGGLGYGLQVFMNGRFQPGFEIFAAAARLKERIRAADLIITGEGAIDRQTQMGKGTGALAQLAQTAGKPCIGLAGYVEETSEGHLFKMTFSITPRLTTSEEAKRNASSWLARISAEAAQRVNETPQL